MNPNRVSGAESTPAPMERQAPAGDYERGTNKTEETAASRELAARPETAPAPLAPTFIPAASPVSVPAADDQTQVTSNQAAHTTDSDRIEKQWIDRAKSVLNQTKDDPHRQKEEVSKVKAEYIQKRFNKTIKIDGTA